MPAGPEYSRWGMKIQDANGARICKMVRDASESSCGSLGDAFFMLLPVDVESSCGSCVLVWSAWDFSCYSLLSVESLCGSGSSRPSKAYPSARLVKIASRLLRRSRSISNQPSTSSRLTLPSPTSSASSKCWDGWTDRDTLFRCGR